MSLHCSPSAGLDCLVNVTEAFLQSGRISALLWSYCQGTGPPDSPQFREILLGRLVALPDLTANRLHANNKSLFLPKQYYPLLATEVLTTLERICQALRGQGLVDELFSCFHNHSTFHASSCI